MTHVNRNHSHARYIGTNQRRIEKIEKGSCAFQPVYNASYPRPSSHRKHPTCMIFS
ncbi:hypothetical protein M408DRAFT_333530 [Serendipita vermifera MAFF 305830]|uniref:Uncharacterized protein n=1 Tax=Serendipita vermifera MAFF 305830 TaxID=933852 RepID=A0A0C3AMT6_SERVB|nr:hypothetical protein M408DRAFT_333530 [Serendipita vermifera MAFF 305830]